MNDTHRGVREGDIKDTEVSVVAEKQPCSVPACCVAGEIEPRSIAVSGAHAKRVGYFDVTT